jgi:putative mRNA 3-end processing factor
MVPLHDSPPPACADRASDLVISTDAGLYCPAGDFYIDPWRPVDRAVITHAHGDHASHGHRAYLATDSGAAVLRARLGAVSVQSLAYGESLAVNGARLSLHPAGHVLGSAQIRIEVDARVWVVSGDYKLEHDDTCASFEPVRCDTFITESTFGLPIYQWRPQSDVFADINRWWSDNAGQNRTSLLFVYAFGKAQRVLAGVDASIGPIVCHGALEPLNRAYREAGIALPPTIHVSELQDKALLSRALVLAPPSAQSTPWLRRFGDYSDGFASGWMQLRGARRRRSVDRGFALSDHADWPSLRRAIEASGAEHIIVTHGYVAPMVRWLGEQGYRANGFETRYGGEQDEGEAIRTETAEAY